MCNDPESGFGADMLGAGSDWTENFWGQGIPEETIREYSDYATATEFVFEQVRAQTSFYLSMAEFLDDLADSLIEQQWAMEATASTALGNLIYEILDDVEDDLKMGGL